MKLRGKLALTLLAGVLPLVLVLTVLQERRARERTAETIAERVIARMEAGGRERCEADPIAFQRRLGRQLARREAPPDLPRERGREPGRRRRRGGQHRARPIAIVIYDRSFRPVEPGAPQPATSLREVVESGATHAHRSVEPSRRGARREILVAMPWEEGPCAYAMIRAPEPAHRMQTSLALGVGVGLATILVALLAISPAIRRLRRLERAASRRASPSGHEAEPDLSHAAEDAVGGSDEITMVARAIDRDREALRAQLRELQRRDHTLLAYVANTTHDVMLPLTVLQGHLAELRDRIPRGDAKSEALRGAIDQADYLGSLLRNLNARARLDAGAVERVQEPVNLSSMVERVIARHARLASDKGLELAHATPEEPVIVVGDETLLERALSNLVHNAVRYHDIPVEGESEGGHVAVVLIAREEGFVLRVLDDGPGIDAAELSQVKERGFRGNAARTRHPHGMGLGLHITDAVLREHGFSLTLRGHDDGGRGLVVEIAGPVATRP